MSQHIDPIDELAELFLTSAEPVSSGSQSESHQGESNYRAVPKRARRELLLAGHLPVRGGLWLPPYLDRVAASQGPTCLLQEDEGGVQIQCANVPVDAIESLSSEKDLERLIVDLAPQIACWILLVSDRMHPVDLVRSRPDQITLLTSADQAALVAAYRTIKVIALAAQEAEIQSPQVDVTVVGCDELRAAQMMDRLKMTTASHLGLQLRLAMTLPRIDVLEHSHRSLHCEGTLSEAVLDVMTAVHVPLAPERSEPVQLSITPGNEEPHQESRQRVEIPSHAGSATDLRAIGAGPSADEAQPCSGETSPVGKGDWSALIAGLKPLRQRCPYDQTIELAVDTEGNLNVLGWHSQLRQLVMVCSWATDHLPLLTEACHAEGLKVSAALRKHLLADNAADLDDLRRCGFELHLVLPEDPNQRPRCIAFNTTHS